MVLQLGLKVFYSGLTVYCESPEATLSRDQARGVHCHTLVASGVHVAHRADTQLTLAALRVVGDCDSRVLVDRDAIFTPDDALRRRWIAGSAPQRGGEAHEDSGGGGRVSEDQLAKTA